MSDYNVHTDTSEKPPWTPPKRSENGRLLVTVRRSFRFEPDFSGGRYHLEDEDVFIEETREATDDEIREFNRRFPNHKEKVRP